MSDYDLEKREGRIHEMRAASPLDAVFILAHYNEVEGQWGPVAQRQPAIELAEVRPDIAPQAYEDALTRVGKMKKGAYKVAEAYYGYDTATRPYEEENAAWLADNPGFSGTAYDMARHAALVALR
jgi:hypothetical protein